MKYTFYPNDMSGDFGWVTEYDTHCKVVPLVYEEERAKPDRRKGKGAVAPVEPANPPVAVQDDYMSDFNESEFDEIASDYWDRPSDIDEDEPWCVEENEDDRALRREYKIEQDDRVEITRRVAKLINSNRYHVFTSAKNNKLSIYWKNREKRTHARERREAIAKLNDIPRARAFYSSRTLKVSKHGLNECIKRAQEWSAWHSDTICILFIFPL